MSDDKEVASDVTPRYLFFPSSNVVFFLKIGDFFSFFLSHSLNFLLFFFLSIFSSLSSLICSILSFPQIRDSLKDEDTYVIVAKTADLQRPVCNYKILRNDEGRFFTNE